MPDRRRVSEPFHAFLLQHSGIIFKDIGTYILLQGAETAGNPQRRTGAYHLPDGIADSGPLSVQYPKKLYRGIRTVPLKSLYPGNIGHDFSGKCFRMILQAAYSSVNDFFCCRIVHIQIADLRMDFIKTAEKKYQKTMDFSRKKVEFPSWIWYPVDMCAG